MEEKERYITLSDRQIKDTYNNSQYFMSIKNVCKILNQQDKRIKELEQQLNKDFTLGEYIRLEQENQQLKQQLHSQPAEIVEKIKKEFQAHLIDWYEDEENTNNDLYIDADWVWEVLDDILQEYQKGEN